MRPFVIFKAQTAIGVRENNRSTVACQLKHHTTDVDGNEHPPENKVFLTYEKTANSNCELTNMILKKVIMPELGVLTQGECACALVDDFKGYSHNDAKDHFKSFKSRMMRTKTRTCTTFLSG